MWKKLSFREKSVPAYSTFDNDEEIRGRTFSDSVLTRNMKWRPGQVFRKRLQQKTVENLEFVHNFEDIGRNVDSDLIHRLVNSVEIMENVFKHMTINQILKLRLTSRLWNEAGAHVLREKIEGVLLLRKGIPHYTELMKKSLSIPVGTVFMHLNDHVDYEVEDFFRLTGYAVQKLIASIDTVDLEEFLSTINLQFLDNTKQIVVHAESITTSGLAQSKQDLIQNYFRTMSNVGLDNFFPINQETPLPRWRRPSVVNEFLKDMHISTSKSIESFSIKSLDDEVFDDYWMSDGGSINNLEAKETVVFKIPSFKINLLKLRVLIVTVKSRNNYEMKSTECLRLLVTSAPNLETATIQGWFTPVDKYVIEDAELKYLKSLTVSPTSENFLMTLSSKVSCKAITKLELVLPSKMSSTGLESLLQKFANSLIHLQLQNDNDELLSFNIPTMMVNLVSIRLLSWVGQIRLDSLEKFAPKLTTLQFGYVQPKNIIWPTNESKTLIMDKINFFALHFFTRELSNLVWSTEKESLLNFIKVFPYVKMFMMRGVKNEIIKLVAPHWPRLSSLKITCTQKLTDEGFVGLYHKSLRYNDVSEQPIQLPCGCVDRAGSSEGSENLSPLSYLTDLEELMIEAEPGTELNFTSTSVHHGFKHLKNLKLLKISCNGFGPQWCLRSLANNLPSLRQVYLMDLSNSGYRYREKDINYFLKKLPQVRLHFITPPRNTRHY